VERFRFERPKFNKSRSRTSQQIFFWSHYNQISVLFAFPSLDILIFSPVAASHRTAVTPQPPRSLCRPPPMPDNLHKAGRPPKKMDEEYITSGIFSRKVPLLTFSPAENNLPEARIRIRPPKAPLRADLPPAFSRDGHYQRKIRRSRR
jgi:hypothetical protein